VGKKLFDFGLVAHALSGSAFVDAHVSAQAKRQFGLIAGAGLLQGTFFHVLIGVCCIMCVFLDFIYSRLQIYYFFGNCHSFYV